MLSVYLSVYFIFFSLKVVSGRYLIIVAGGCVIVDCKDCGLVWWVSV